MSEPAGPASSHGRVVLLAGPSGSGKSHLARASGLSVLCLDEFYKDGRDPTCPRDERLGIIDWDDPASWDADAAMTAIDRICRTGWCEVPTYDICQDRSVGSTRFSRDERPAFIAEGIFVAQVVARCRDAGLLADAIVVDRAPWKNFARRLARDLTERRKPPLTLIRRGRALMAQEQALVSSLVAAGCRPLTATGATDALARWAREPATDSA
ncbi:MAG: uridine kinase [Jiangellales bacterium]